MKALVNSGSYREMISAVLPKVIQSDEENERAIALLESIYAEGSLSPEKQQLADLLSLLIENFEAQAYSFPSASPIETLRHLMDSNSLKQVDLADIFGSPSVLSEVLSGKRRLAKSHIQGLSERFQVPTDVFFDRPGTPAKP